MAGSKIARAKKDESIAKILFSLASVSGIPTESRVFNRRVVHLSSPNISQESSLWARLLKRDLYSYDSTATHTQIRESTAHDEMSARFSI